MKILPFVLKTVGTIVSRLPIEQVLIKPHDTSKDRQELLDILTPQPEPEPQAKSATGLLEPRQKTLPKQTADTAISEQETFDYQKREICKLLLRMERHYAQRMRINNIPCSCGASKHLLDIESLTEETIPMADNPDIYYQVLDWVRKVGPISTEEAAKSGKYDTLYPQFSHEARNFRKEIIGSLDPKALWPGKPVSIEDLFKKFDDTDKLSAPPTTIAAIEDAEQSEAAVTPLPEITNEGE